MSFVTAMQTRDARTANGMAAHSTTGSKVLDLFGKMGALRTSSDEQIIRLIEAAYAESPALTLRAIFYARDIRGGQGERRTFRVAFRWLAQNHPDIATVNLSNIPFYGRWDDLLAATAGTSIEQQALHVYAVLLAEGDKLAAKWAPREKKAGHATADKLRRKLGLDWRGYRKLLAGNTSVVETKMCAKLWSEINYSHVPSVASLRYRTAFHRNDGERYKAWVDALTKGTDPKVKVNAAAVYPHDIITPLMPRLGLGQPIAHGIWQTPIYPKSVPLTEVQMLSAQWAALPNYMPVGRKILPIVDTSASMNQFFDGLALRVAIALGLYTAERNVGPFRNALMTFSGKPQFALVPSGLNLKDRIELLLKNSPWGQNTDLRAVFTLILGQARANNLPPEDMPDTVLIVSDMQFDACVQGETGLDMVSREYEAAGYKRPNVVFWNVNAHASVPVKTTDRGTAIVSGFSPAALKGIFSGDLGDLTPYGVMLATLNDERYDRVVLPELAA